MLSTPVGSNLRDGTKIQLTTSCQQLKKAHMQSCSRLLHQHFLPQSAAKNAAGLPTVPLVTNKEYISSSFFYTTCKHICMSPVIRLSSTCTASSDPKQVSLSTVKRHWRLSTHKEGSMENMEETGASTSRTISNLFTYLRRTFMLLVYAFWGTRCQAIWQIWEVSCSE